MTATTTASQISAKVAEAVTAIEAGEYATALAKLLSAKALLVTLPRRSAKNGTELEYDAASIDTLIVEVRRLRAAGGGVRQTQVEYQTTPPTDD